MSDHSEFEKIKKMAPEPGEAEKSARSLEEAVDSHHTLEGFEAMNNEHFSPELEREAKEEHSKDGKK